jgi:hypothetical protein
LPSNAIIKAAYSCTGLLREGSTQRSSKRLFCFDAAVRARKLMGQCRGRTHLPIRSGKTNRGVPALIERLAQAWLIVTSLRNHPDELIRQAHLDCAGQKQPPSWRVTPVTRRSYGKKKRVNMYLLNPIKRKSAAHHWDGADTLCRMYSSNGLLKAKQQVTSDPMGKEICLMCQNVKRHQWWQAFINKDWRTA